jgi:hypothetical protein
LGGLIALSTSFFQELTLLACQPSKRSLFWTALFVKP